MKTIMLLSFLLVFPKVSLAAVAGKVNQAGIQVMTMMALNTKGHKKFLAAHQVGPDYLEAKVKKVFEGEVTRPDGHTYMKEIYEYTIETSDSLGTDTVAGNVTWKVKETVRWIHESGERTFENIIKADHN